MITLQSRTGKYRASQGNPCTNENRITAMRIGFPVMKTGFFHVRIVLQGIPCKPQRVWVCSLQYHFCLFNYYVPKMLLKIVIKVCKLPLLILESDTGNISLQSFHSQNALSVYWQQISMTLVVKKVT